MFLYTSSGLRKSKEFFRVLTKKNKNMKILKVLVNVISMTVVIAMAFFSSTILGWFALITILITLVYVIRIGGEEFLTENEFIDDFFELINEIKKG